jgi:hypothetical protein
VVKGVDHAAKTVTVKTADGGEETYHLTDRAARETGKGLGKASTTPKMPGKKLLTISRRFNHPKELPVGKQVWH